MSVIICTSLSECLERLDKELNDAEREAELVAGLLESLDEKEATFEEFVKRFGGGGGEAIYHTKVNSFEIYVQPHPSKMKEELSKKAKEISDLIEKLRALRELIEKIIETLSGLEAEAVILLDKDVAKLFINIRWG
ncbi:hypothetical protein [Ignicoccus hospitalis]|uniref:Uncharacterized protein n=1 Tax=Ignicoccus hospitalis (strain KIN4/I / DSM 18386 / JCM 14125) TaxID=453591 RepID=A8AA74_IGNH4|nr:hypothetical protein [Ignicoccus hospitalis]ABU81826.1 hypothetical protein Igni_0644 [Ignicoccus hospitalis KIN4/I]HIH90095.1 hypothetical protein [Desulfurococcaceae archaeon]